MTYYLLKKLMTKSKPLVQDMKYTVVSISSLFYVGDLTSSLRQVPCKDLL